MLKPKITAEKIAQLREISGRGMKECKWALNQADWNMDKAIKILHNHTQAIFKKNSNKIP